MKDAYLIIANKNHNQLQKLITMLDDSRNDIYLMIDKKSKDFPLDFHTDFSELNYVKPVNIYWGGYSQIRAELILFRAASKEHYNYYHLMSGLDLPIANQDEIHNFFDNHPKREFIAYSKLFTRNHLSQRLKPHLLRKHFRSKNPFYNMYHFCENKFIHLLKSPIPINKIDMASNWVTIDDSLVQLLVKRSHVIYELYKYGRCEDELFIPILLNYYPTLKKRVYYKIPMDNRPNDFQGNMVYINWWGGPPYPYIWQYKDYYALLKAKSKGYLFSRKFNENVDNKIINKVFNSVMKLNI